MNRIEREKKTIGQMVSLYCRRKEHNRELCIDCTGLLMLLCYPLAAIRHLLNM